MRFKPSIVPLITVKEVETLLKSRAGGVEKAKVSLDLGPTEEDCLITPGAAVIRGLRVRWDLFEKVRKKDGVYMVSEEKVLEASVSASHFYRLRIVKHGKPPTLEIDGIHMHRIRGITPELDALNKVRLLGRLRCKTILDTCMGLGYTASATLKLGGCRVVTVEKDPNVLAMAMINPWSRMLSDSRVEVLTGDVFKEVTRYEHYFDAVVHDPPRFSLAGELYGGEFYQRLYGAMKKDARLVHYVGQPGVLRGVKIYVGVMRRLKEAGFTTRYFPDAGGILSVRL